MTVQADKAKHEPGRKSLDTILVKPAGPDCNMSCDYCFYLEKAELFGPNKTHRMTQTILKELIRQAMHQADREINFIWQGGEPMLRGLNFFRKAVELNKGTAAVKQWETGCKPMAS